MYLAGLVLSLTIVFAGFILSQVFFYNLNGRFFWRAFIPAALRFTIMPEDKVELDCYDILTEYATLMLLGSFLTLPFIALNHIGFVHFW